MLQKFALITALTLSALGLAHADDAALAEGAKYNKTGFVAAVQDGRLWVFKADDTTALEEFKSTGELGKNAARIGAGPEGMTIRAANDETLDGYLNAQ